MPKVSKVKKCIVPSCNNTSTSTPNKLFITVPLPENIRKRWFMAVGLVYTNFDGKVSCFACEDHFILDLDALNWMEFKTIGTQLRMKRDVVPHIFPSPTNLVLSSKESQLTKSARERRLENLNRFAKNTIANKLKKELDSNEDVDEVVKPINQVFLFV